MSFESGMALERRQSDPDPSLNSGVVGSHRGAYKTDMADLLHLFLPTQDRHRTRFNHDGRSDPYPHET